jgi:hypothetical protein
MTVIHPPRHVVWSTDELDINDPFQRRWYLRQVLMHGRAEDIHALDLQDIRNDLESLDLPPDIYSLWKTFLKVCHVEG